MLYNYFEQRRSSYKSRQLYITEVVYKNNDKDEATMRRNLRRKSPHICSGKCFQNQNHTCCQYWCGVASSWNAKKLCARATANPNRSATATKPSFS